MNDSLAIHSKSDDLSVLSLQVELPATPAEVFRCFTEPTTLTKWWPQEAEIEPGTGGSYVLKWPAMGWTLRGSYLVFESDSRLRFTWNWDHGPNLPERIVEISFHSAERNSCRLEITHGDYDSGSIDQEDRSSHEQGWRHFLGQLNELLVH